MSAEAVVRSDRIQFARDRSTIALLVPTRGPAAGNHGPTVQRCLRSGRFPIVIPQ